MIAPKRSHYSGTDESPRAARRPPRRPRGPQLRAPDRLAALAGGQPPRPPAPAPPAAPPPPPAKYAAPPPPLRPQQQQQQMYEEPPPTFGSTMKTYFTLGIGVSLGVTAFSVLLRMIGF